MSVSPLPSGGFHRQARSPGAATVRPPHPLPRRIRPEREVARAADAIGARQTPCHRRGIHPDKQRGPHAQPAPPRDALGATTQARLTPGILPSACGPAFGCSQSLQAIGSTSTCKPAFTAAAQYGLLPASKIRTPSGSKGLVSLMSRSKSGRMYDDISGSDTVDPAIRPNQLCRLPPLDCRCRGLQQPDDIALQREKILQTGTSCEDGQLSAQRLA